MTEIQVRLNEMAGKNMANSLNDEIRIKVLVESELESYLDKRKKFTQIYLREYKAVIELPHQCKIVFS